MADCKFPEKANELSPMESRELFRANKYYGPSSGFSMGYVQANLAIVPSSLADVFEEFCKRNCAALPVLYRSENGELGAPPLAKDSNVSTDLPRYIIYSHGRQVDDMLDLDGFDLSNHTSFYIGCSFTFEKALQNAGISTGHVREGNNVAMFTTNIDCYNVGGRFPDVKMVVSMRGIPKDKLQLATAISSSFPSCHGGPIHIGDPAKLGITDITTPTYGDHTATQENDIPVFWGCGVTSKHAVEALKADLVFTHYPGSMFVTDLPATPLELSPEEAPLVVTISPERSPYFASLVSGKCAKILESLEEVILDDPGGCRVRDIREEDDFMKTVLCLSHASSIAIIFGFPCNTDYDNMEESDGPPGVLAVAQALQALGKNITIVSESRNRSMTESSIQLLISNGALSGSIPFTSCEEMLEKEGEGYDCLLAIERVGRSEGGAYYSASGNDLSAHVQPIDRLFESAEADTVTLSVGDRGNELGLGRVRKKVEEYMKGGARVGCVVGSDYTVLAGVSNWGGYAIALGLYMVSRCSVHSRYVQHGVNVEHRVNSGDLNHFIVTNEQYIVLMQHLNSLGVRDGINKALNKSVDGVSVDQHLLKLNQLRAVAKSL